MNALEILAVEPDPADFESAVSAAERESAEQLAAAHAPAAGSPLTGEGRFESQGADHGFFVLAAASSAVVVSTDPQTLALSGGLGVDVVKPQTVNDLIAAREQARA